MKEKQTENDNILAEVNGRASSLGLHLAGPVVDIRLAIIYSGAKFLVLNIPDRPITICDLSCKHVNAKSSSYGQSTRTRQKDENKAKNWRLSWMKTEQMMFVNQRENKC